MILITGASGKTGKTILQAFSKKGLDTRAFIRDPNKAEELKNLGATEIYIGDMLNEEDIHKATQDIKAIYHICPNMHPQEIQIGELIIRTAQSAEINHFVYHSVLRPQIESMPHHWNKMKVEEKLFKSGLNFTILQPAAYFQNLFSLIQNNTLRIPYDIDIKLSMVDLQDVAQVARNIVGNEDHFGAVYELCSTKPINHAEIATLIGPECNAEQISIKDWRMNAENAGLGDYQITTLIKMFDYYQKHGFIGNGNVLKWLLGRTPNTLQDILNKKAGA